MPDKHGWHDTPYWHNGHMWRTHYCAGQDHDTDVLNTPLEMAKHFQACADRQRAAKKARDEYNQARRLEALAAAREAKWAK